MLHQYTNRTETDIDVTPTYKTEQRQNNIDVTPTYKQNRDRY
jgi:hypothetical protein